MIYLVMFDDPGGVAALCRFDSATAVFESYRPGVGWVASSGSLVADIMRNGQDYDMIDEAEAERLASSMEDADDD